MIKFILDLHTTRINKNIHTDNKDSALHTAELTSWNRQINTFYTHTNNIKIILNE